MKNILIKAMENMKVKDNLNHIKIKKGSKINERRIRKNRKISIR